MGFMDDVRNEMQQANRAKQVQNDSYSEVPSQPGISGNFMDMVMQEMSQRPEQIQKRQLEEAMSELEQEVKIKLFSMIKSNDLRKNYDTGGYYVSCDMAKCPSFKKVFPKYCVKITKGFLSDTKTEKLCPNDSGKEYDTCMQIWDSLKTRLGLEGIRIEENWNGFTARVDLPE